jgi:Gpi18-like mannosyltransferase
VRSEDLAIHLVVTTAQIAAVLLLFSIARHWRNERVATTAVALLLLLPSSVFLWMFYTEGLFLALSMGAILAAERDRPLLAGILGVGVAATRSVGVLIALPLALAAWQRRATFDRRAIWCLLPALGVAAVMLAQWIQAGDALAFVDTSQHWETQAQLPTSTFVERLDFIGHTRFSMTSAIDVAAVLLAVACGVVAMRIAMPWSHRAWLWIVVLAPLSSGLIFSWSRYMLIAWPALLVGAEVVERRPFVAKVIVATLLAILTVNRIGVWHAGTFIG